MFEKMGQSFMSFSGTGSLKKSLEEKNREKSKIYGYIGMEAYDLYKAGKLRSEELVMHFRELEILEKEITELEEQIAKAANAGKIVCSCGKVLNSQMKFCPSCGKPVEPDVVTCVCGRQVKSNMSFCPYCGNNMKENTADTGAEKNAGQAEEKVRECICGAKIQEGQFMCMECGRKVEG